MANNFPNELIREEPIHFKNDRIIRKDFQIAENHTAEVKLLHTKIIDLLGEINVIGDLSNPSI